MTKLQRHSTELMKLADFVRQELTAGHSFIEYEMDRIGKSLLDIEHEAVQEQALGLLNLKKNYKRGGVGRLDLADHLEHIGGMLSDENE